MTAVGLATRGVSVFAIDDIRSLDAFQWDELCANCPDLTVFQSRGWLQTYAHVFLGSPEDMRIIVATEGSRLVGLAPLMRARDSRRSRGTKWLILGDDYSDYQSFLAWRGSPKIIEALLDGIDRFLPPGESIAFLDVPQFSVLGLCLAARAARGQVIQQGATTCPALQIRHNPRGVARVLAKASLRRSERSLSTLGAVTLQHSWNAAEIAERLPVLYAQHEIRWRGSSSPSLFCSAKPQEFYRKITAVLAPQGGVHYTTVSLDGRVVAQHFGLRSRDTLIWYKPAFDVALREHSPGDVLIKALVQYASDTGLQELDFSRGDESFKNRFASLIRYDCNFFWYRQIGRRTLAKLRERGRVVRDSVKRRRSMKVPILGGAADTIRKKFVLLLNADSHTVAAWASVSREEGFQVRAIVCNESSELPNVHESTLVVPCDEASAEALSLLPQNHPVRLRALLPYSSEDPCSDSREQVRRLSVLVTCVCSGGTLIQYFVATADEVTPSLPSPLVLLHLSKEELNRRGWHGPATVRFTTNADGQIAVERILPCLQLVGSAVRSRVSLSLSLWRLASGLGTAPQPLQSADS